MVMFVVGLAVLQKPVFAQGYVQSTIQSSVSRDELIRHLWQQISVLQQLLLQIQAQNPISVNSGVWQSAPDAIVNNKGPQKNVMSCARGADTYLVNGSLACYGLHDYGGEFGDDQENCGGLDPEYEQRVPTGCVVTAPVCKSNRAIATDFYHVSQASPLKISQLAKNFQATESAVHDQLIRIWEYQCTDKSLTNLTSTIDLSQVGQDYGDYNPDWNFIDSAADILVVGAYTGNAKDGSINVNVSSANQDSLLVLTAYDPVTWNLSGTALKNIKAVFITGYENQKITGLPAGVKVMSAIYEADNTSKYFYVFDKDSVEYYELMDYLHDKTGHTPYLFFGGYEQSNVTVSIKG